MSGISSKALRANYIEKKGMDQFPHKTVSKIIEVLLQQAEYFLTEADEFYPFAIALGENQEIIPIGIHTGKEYPDSTEVMNELEKALVQGIREKKYLLTAMGVDVYLTINNEKKTAVQIKYMDETTLGGLSYDMIYYVYEKKDGKYVLEYHSGE